MIKPMSLKEACEYLNCTPSTIYKLTHEKKIPHYKPGGKRIFFLEKDLRAYVLSKVIKPKKV